MEKAVSAAEANRRFSLILREVREGGSYVVTSHGKPVARILPADARETTAAGARSALISRLEKQSIVHTGKWSRDELYEDEP
ncbi:type II toxin-antitoxin system Phd/YefM family antitoxin [Rhizobium sp. LCM 4573]|uniref:type II toxin-antitoxin system Phd/YefM family antitoxin n=1 Tax=Rhizobium sp. LCM 4573 TaxID=1848291 RepID=UPI0009F5D4B7|nr:type II toxin-antitoxin system prevent-host-death family antitoxin [Rhizobium sp. LCM 4573]